MPVSYLQFLWEALALGAPGWKYAAWAASVLAALAFWMHTMAQQHSSSSPTQVSLSINTTQTVTTLLRQRPETPGLPAYLPALAVLFGLPVMSRRTRQRLRRLSVPLCRLTIFWPVLSLNGCGGNSGSGSIGNPPQAQTTQNTPAETYNIMVVATSGTLSHSSQITLVVQ